MCPQWLGTEQHSMSALTAYIPTSKCINTNHHCGHIHEYIGNIISSLFVYL